MKVAMIGAGGYARAHLDVLEKEEGIKVVGHVSPTPASRNAAAQRYGGRAYSSCAELLASEQVDAAWISVPPHVHGEIETIFIQHGIPFFVEKPLSADRHTAERIAASIAEQGLTVGVGYKFRALSSLSQIQAHLEKHPVRLLTAAWHGGTPDVTWWQRQEMSGGQMVEQATHLVDLARYLAGEARVNAATVQHVARPGYPDLNVATTSTGLLEFDSGATGFISCTCLLEGAREVYLKLVCDGSLVTITPETITFEGGGEQRRITVSDDLVAVEDRAFISAVREGDASLVLSSYADALLTHKLCFDMVDASKAQQT